MSKTAIVTGGSRGIGRATAIELSKMGMNVAVIYCGNQAKAEETVAACKENGVDAIALKCDVKVKDEALITKDGAVVGGNKIKMGMPITLEGKTYKFTGSVSDLNILDEEK